MPVFTASYSIPFDIELISAKDIKIYESDMQFVINEKVFAKSDLAKKFHQTSDIFNSVTQNQSLRQLLTLLHMHFDLYHKKPVETKLDTRLASASGSVVHSMGVWNEYANKLLPDTLIGIKPVDIEPGAPYSTAPDFCNVNVTLCADGSLAVCIREFTENVHGRTSSFRLGLENGKPVKESANTIYKSTLDRDAIVSGPDHLNGYVSPDFDITASAWDLLENKDAAAARCKGAIQKSLVRLVDKSKDKLMNLMHPTIPAPSEGDDISPTL